MKVERVDARDQAADALMKGSRGRVEWGRLVGIIGMIDTANGIALREGA